MPVTLVLLLVVFGALIAAGIPLLLAGTAVASAISLLAIPSRWLPVSSTTSSVVLLVGMAVGVDYSLFYLRREREERAAGRSVRQALRIASATSGRAIAASGLIDATIVRSILLPAAMTLLGDRNWYLPRWLAWMPGLQLETTAPSPAADRQQAPEPDLTRQPA